MFHLCPKYPFPGGTTSMDTSPTALFDSYEQDYKQLIQSIDDRLVSVKADDGLKGGTPCS